ncbi:MAG: hypothetical protein ACI4JI_04530 [Ruminiclostridium sp.]
MAYNTNDIRGYAQDGFRFSGEEGKELYNTLKEIMEDGIAAKRIPAVIFDDVMKSGGMFGTKLPMFVISHSNNSSCRYFMIGVLVNGNEVLFPLLGESAENTKFNKKKYYEENGNYIKAALIKPDEFKLHQEISWQKSILDIFNDIIN